MRRRRWPSRLAAVATLAVIPVAAGAVWLASPAEPADPGAELSMELAAGGVPAEVIGCVLRLAAGDLRLGPLDGERQRELVDGCQTAQRSLAAAEEAAARPEAPPAEPEARPDTLGDDPDLDRLWTACEAGSGAACDQLFERAPAGSGYETFGLTCGNRPDLLDCPDLETPHGSDGHQSPGPGSADPKTSASGRIAASARVGGAEGRSGIRRTGHMQ